MRHRQSLLNQEQLELLPLLLVVRRGLPPLLLFLLLSLLLALLAGPPENVPDDVDEDEVMVTGKPSWEYLMILMFTFCFQVVCRGIVVSKD